MPTEDESEMSHILSEEEILLQKTENEIGEGIQEYGAVSSIPVQCSMFINQDNKILNN